MKETTITCDKCKRRLSYEYVEVNLNEHRTNQTNRLEFCDRLCLVKYFEEQPQ